jgi:hypothetical protein
MEIVFSVTQERDGGYVAECLGYDIFAQGDDWNSLRDHVAEAVNAYFFDQIAIPNHRPLRLRTLVAILRSVENALGIPRSEILDRMD